MNPPRKSSFHIVLHPAHFLGSCLWLLVSPTAHAIVDTNNNCLSDLWEKHFNSGNLLTDPDPLADPDGDGWTQAQEAAAGTDPFDPNPPGGFLHPDFLHVPETWADSDGDDILEHTPETVVFTWETIPGKKYTLLASPDLSGENWSAIGEPMIGNGNIIENGFPITESQNPRPDKLFWRVAVTESGFDSDSDGLSNYEEFLAGTDPVISDSDGDTLSDYDEIIAATNPFNPDEDGDGLTDPFELAAGTDSKNQDSDGDAIPDSIDSHPLLSAQVFADADDDGIPDADDPDPNNPRGPKPLIVSDNASGNPQCELETDESSSFILTVSNPAGPAPTSSDFKLYLNGTEETANITALTTPPSAVGTQRFNLSWLAKVTTGYPTQTLQNISLRFKDAQNATTWLNVARVDVAEWEGMIAGVSCEGLNSGNFPIVDVISHYKGVKQSSQRLVYGNSIWYRGPKTIPLLDASGSNIGTTAQIGAERYPLFLISKSGSAYTIEQTLDISNPVAYPHHGKFYINRTAAAITMSPSTVGSIQIPARAIDQSPGIRFQPFPPAPETGTPNIGVLGTSFINEQESTIYSGVWELQNASGNARDFSSLEFTSVAYENGTTEVANDGTGRLRAGIGATITPHSAGTLEHPGMPISLPDFPPAPYNNHASRTPLLPVQSEQWHKFVLKVGPDAGALSNGITLKLGTGEEGENDPQTGFILQTPGTGGFEPLTIPANGKIEMAPTSDLYQKLTSIEGLTLFLKRDSTVSEFHRLGLDLIPKHSTYLIQRIAAVDIPPLDLVPDINMAGVVGDVVESAVISSNIKHFVTPKVTTELPQEYVILRATGVTAEQITDGSAKQIVEWDGGEAVPSEPLKRKVKRNTPASHPVKIKAKQGGEVAVQMNVWVVWCTLEAIDGTPKMQNPVDTGTSLRLVGEIRFRYACEPTKMFDLKSDVPALNVPWDTTPPGTNHPWKNTPLAFGAEIKIDASRQFRVLSKSNDANTHAALQAAGPDITAYPQNSAEGNDDPSILGELRPYLPLGITARMADFDTPFVEIPHTRGSETPQATISELAQFRQFSRAEIGNRWYKISDFFLSEIYFKAKRENGKWVDNTSTFVLGNGQFPPP